MILCLRLVLVEFLVLAAAALAAIRVFLDSMVMVVFSVLVEFGVLEFILDALRVFLEAIVIVLFTVHSEFGVSEPTTPLAATELS